MGSKLPSSVAKCVATAVLIYLHILKANGAPISDSTSITYSEDSEIEAPEIFSNVPVADPSFGALPEGSGLRQTPDLFDIFSSENREKSVELFQVQLDDMVFNDDVNFAGGNSKNDNTMQNPEQGLVVTGLLIENYYKNDADVQSESKSKPYTELVEMDFEKYDTVKCFQPECELLANLKPTLTMNDQYIIDDGLADIFHHFFDLQLCTKKIKLFATILNRDSVEDDQEDIAFRSVVTFLKCKFSRESLPVLVKKLKGIKSGASIVQNLDLNFPEQDMSIHVGTVETSSLEAPPLSSSFDVNDPYPTIQPSTKNEENTDENKSLQNIKSDGTPASMKYRHTERTDEINEDQAMSLSTAINESLIHIYDNATPELIEIDVDETDKYLLHPLYIFPIMFISLIIACIAGTAYNKCMGRTVDTNKFLKVPRMAVFSAFPNLSVLPSVKSDAVEVHEKNNNAA